MFIWCNDLWWSVRFFYAFQIPPIAHTYTPQPPKAPLHGTLMLFIEALNGPHLQMWICSAFTEYQSEVWDTPALQIYQCNFSQLQFSKHSGRRWVVWDVNSSRGALMISGVKIKQTLVRGALWRSGLTVMSLLELKEHLIRISSSFTH